MLLDITRTIYRTLLPIRFILHDRDCKFLDSFQNNRRSRFKPSRMPTSRLLLTSPFANLTVQFSLTSGPERCPILAPPTSDNRQNESLRGRGHYVQNVRIAGTDGAITVPSGLRRPQPPLPCRLPRRDVRFKPLIFNEYSWWYGRISVQGLRWESSIRRKDPYGPTAPMPRAVLRLR